MQLARETETFIREVPKAEYHLHFEGAFRWQTIKAVHPRGRSLPETPPWWRNKILTFRDFEKIFADYILPATGTPELIERHMYEVLSDLAAQRVRYVEISFSLHFHSGRGLEIEEILQAVQRGKTAAESTYDITVRIIAGLSRRRSEDNVLDLLQRAISVRTTEGRNIVDGVDLYGDERLGLPEVFVKAFALAKGAGIRLKAHAGEFCGSESILQVMNTLNVQDISHGVRACESRELIEKIVCRGIYLHLCPSSNVCLGISPSISSHPFRTLFDAGCQVTINTDDPLIFRSNLTNEIGLIAKFQGFSVSELASVCNAAFNNALMSSASLDVIRNSINELAEDCCAYEGQNMVSHGSYRSPPDSTDRVHR